MRKKDRTLRYNCFLGLVFPLLAFLFSACEKVIDVDLNSASPVIVIEGSVSDQSASAKVQLTKTINFDQQNTFPAVAGATVTIRDNMGNSEVLTENPLGSGIYQGNSFSGVSGRHYTLHIASEGKEYVATSYLSFPVAIDTITVEPFNLFGQTRNILNVKFTDPPGIKNFYQLVTIINADTLNALYITSDELEDGAQITYVVYDNDTLASGDTVHVLLRSIDKETYDYMLLLTQLLNGGGQSASPANPPSNFGPSALGYFSAYSVSEQTIVVP